jgi:hypothetical protein
MLQSSQIEKPRCSANIDQMRLRWAMDLPVDLQNFSSSGFHSEIQVGFRFLISVFLSGWDKPPRQGNPGRPAAYAAEQQNLGHSDKSEVTAVNY